MNWHTHSAWWLILLLAIGIAVYAIMIIFTLRKTPARPALREIAPPAASDRILILAPHEDDETLGCGGLIQQAAAAGAAVRVVYLTCGDHNQLAFMVYRKRPWLSPRVNRSMGEIRINEAIEAMASFGIPARQLVFLGYPDHDTLKIWNTHWGESPTLHSVLTDTTHVPYKQAPGCGKPYKGESIVADIERELIEFRPTQIFVTHPIDANPDHRAYYLFLRVALLNLAGRIPDPRIFTYPIHMGPWPRPHFFHPNMWLAFPRRLAYEKPCSLMLDLAPGEVNRKHRAIRLYKSQMSDCGYWLTAFARRNELFTPIEPIALVEGADWSPHRAAVASAETSDYDSVEARGHVLDVSYRNDPRGLMVRVDLRHPLKLALGAAVEAFGYRSHTPFGKMPKLRIDYVMGRLVVHDREVRIPIGGINAELKNDFGELFVPWEMLGNPEAIFVQTHGLSGLVSRAYTPWQVFTLTKGQVNHGAHREDTYENHH
jgi:LmbE family N-acetylglucosaminyl deacetylase